MPPKPSWFSLTTTQQRELEAYARMPGWRILSKESLPTVFPPTFRRKLDSGVLIAGPTSSGGTYLVCNALRVDARARAIDQEPFAVIVHTAGASTAAMFLHHGTGPRRTQPPPPGFWEQVAESGVGNYFLVNPPSGTTGGTLDQLPADHRAAFDSAISHVRASTRR